MTPRNVISLSLGAMLLTACSLGSNGSPLAGPAVPFGRQHSHVRSAVTSIVIPGNSCCVIAVDRPMRQIYVSSAVNLSGNNTTVVDAKTFSVIDSVSGFGGANNVDSSTHNVWLAGLYSGEVEAYSGRTHSQVATISLGYCPIGSWVDPKRRYAWVSAQCGSGSDPVWAINADTYAVIAGPIHTGGVMNPITPANPITGRLYINNSSGTFEINPHTFAVSPTSFGVVLNFDQSTNLLYARITDGLNIVTGWSEKITKTLSLPYTPYYVAVDSSLNHIYTGSGADGVIEVREGTTGSLLGTIKLTGVTIINVGADYASGGAGHIYAAGSSGSSTYLYDLRDTF